MVFFLLSSTGQIRGLALIECRQQGPLGRQFIPVFTF